MNQKELNNSIAIASMKLAAIQPALGGTYPDMTKSAYYTRISGQPFKFPDGHEVLYSPGTYACWESAFRKGGFDALIPRERSDKGHARKLDADVIAKIYDLREKYPRLTATGIRDKMIMDGFISGVAALCAVQLCPVVRGYILPSHISAEPAGQMLMKELGFEPMIHGNMRLGEGTGAVALMPLLDMAVAVYKNAASFDDIQVEAYEKWKSN